jgi:hypothetical protein
MDDRIGLKRDKNMNIGVYKENGKHVPNTKFSRI